MPSNSWSFGFVLLLYLSCCDSECHSNVPEQAKLDHDVKDSICEQFLQLVHNSDKLLKDTCFDNQLVRSPPNMLLLHSLPTIDAHTREVNIIAGICRDNADVDVFGYHILQDKTATKVPDIKKTSGPSPVRITREILKEWLNGRGEQPVTWKTLIRALKACQLHTLVEDIKASVRPGSLNTPFTGPVYDETLRFAEELRAVYRSTDIIDKYQRLLSSIRGIGDAIPFVLPIMESSVHLDQIIRKIQPSSKTLFTGRPGVGKSTLTRYMAHKWAQGELLTYCVLTIRVPLSRAIASLHEVLQKALLDYTQVFQVEQEIKNNHGRQICFILDAFDEYVLADTEGNDWVYNLLRNVSLQQATVIVTSRNDSRLEKLVNTEIFSNMDQVFGFSVRSLDSYLDQLPLPMKTTISALFQGNINVKRMCYLPLHMTMVVYMASVDVNRLSGVEKETVLYTDFLALTVEKYRDRHGWTAKMVESCLNGQASGTNLCNLIFRLCALAYHSLIQGAHSFALTDLDHFEFHTLQQLSLFGVEIEREKYGDLYHYTFPHKTFQEYLAAFHMSNSQDTYDEMLTRFCIDQTKTVWKFYFGILWNYKYVNNSTKVYKTFVNFATSLYDKHHRYFTKYYKWQDQLKLVLLLAFDTGIQSTLLSSAQDIDLIRPPDCGPCLQYAVHTMDDCFFLPYVLSWITAHRLCLGFNTDSAFEKAAQPDFDKENCIVFQNQLIQKQNDNIHQLHLLGGLFGCHVFSRLLPQIQLQNLSLLEIWYYCEDSDLKELLVWLPNQPQLQDVSLKLYLQMGDNLWNLLSNVFARLQNLHLLTVKLSGILSDRVMYKFFRCVMNLPNLEELVICPENLNESLSTEVLLLLDNSRTQLQQLRKLTINSNIFDSKRRLHLVTVALLPHLPKLEHVIINNNDFSSKTSVIPLKRGFSAARELNTVELHYCMFDEESEENVFDSLIEAKTLEMLRISVWSERAMNTTVLTRTIAQLRQLQYLELKFRFLDEYTQHPLNDFSKGLCKSLSRVPRLTSLHVTVDQYGVVIIARFSPSGRTLCPYVRDCYCSI